MPEGYFINLALRYLKWWQYFLIVGMCAFGFATIFFAVLMIIGGFKSFVVNPS